MDFIADFSFSPVGSFGNLELLEQSVHCCALGDSRKHATRLVCFEGLGFRVYSNRKDRKPFAYGFYLQPYQGPTAYTPNLATLHHTLHILQYIAKGELRRDVPADHEDDRVTRVCANHGLMTECRLHFIDAGGDCTREIRCTAYTLNNVSDLR